MTNPFNMGARQAQRGAATLVVVMVLFLVMALLAAYANRSLMFEQRISGSYYRASMAQEMAEGGLDWTVAMLNGSGIDANCQPVNSGGTRFADKYLVVSPADRSIQSLSTAPTAFAVDCVRTGNALVCRCPAPDNRTTQPTTTVTGNLVPSVGVALVSESPNTRYGSFMVTSQGCTNSSVDSCISGGSEARSQGAIATSVQKAALAFVAAVPSSPSSPLTVKGSLTTSGSGGLGLHNTDPASAGVLVVSGEAAPITLIDSRMDSVPGTPSSLARAFGDTQLRNMSSDAFFRVYMGMTPGRYRNHPSLQFVTCNGDCGPALQAAYDAGKRILWVDTAMTISSNVVIGAVNDPPLIIVNGAVTLTGPMQINGMLVALGNLDWTNTGGLTSLITGMLLVQGNMVATGSMDVYYLQSIANQLRNRQGSYVRVSGGWIDGDSD